MSRQVETVLGRKAKPGEDGIKETLSEEATFERDEGKRPGEEQARWRDPQRMEDPTSHVRLGSVCTVLSKCVCSCLSKKC